MSEIGAVGIERVSTISVAETSNKLPDRHALLPDGQAVVAYAEQLYPVNNIQRQMMAFADPSAALMTCWRNDDFRRSLGVLIDYLHSKQQDNKSFFDAIELLEKLNEEQSLLQITLNLLHKV